MIKKLYITALAIILHGCSSTDLHINDKTTLLDKVKGQVSVKCDYIGLNFKRVEGLNKTVVEVGGLDKNIYKSDTPVTFVMDGHHYNLPTFDVEPEHSTFNNSERSYIYIHKNYTIPTSVHRVFVNATEVKFLISQPNLQSFVKCDNSESIKIAQFFANI